MPSALADEDMVLLLGCPVNRVGLIRAQVCNRRGNILRQEKLTGMGHVTALIGVPG